MKRAAAAGALAVVAALGVAELIAAITPGASSPLDAVGQQLVARAPAGVLTWAISALGASNRAVLTVGSVLVAASIGAALGVVARRSLLVASAVVVVVAVGATLAVTAQPGTALPAATVSTAAAAGTWFVCVSALLARVRAGVSSPLATPVDPDVDRRAFLRLALTVGAVGLGGGVLGRALHGGTDFGLVDPTTIELPSAARVLAPVRPGMDLAARLDGATPLLTPNDRFFRIDTAIALPYVDPADWSLRVHGRVDREVELTYDELLARPLREVDATIACVSNEVGGDLVGTARWLGVPLRDLLEEAGIGADAEQVVGRAVDGWTGGFPIELALDDGRADGALALVAVGMNGEALPVRHGFPARLVVPGVYGYVSATKWLSDIELTAWDGVDGYWVPRGWSKDGPVKTMARIDLPASGSTAASGDVVVAGVAWAPTRGISRVEVSVDDGPWGPAEVLPALSAATWVQWRTTTSLGAGRHRVAARAIDGRGAVQPAGPAPPAPDGAEGWHAVTFEVA